MPNTAREQLLSDLSLETQAVQRRVKTALPLIEREALATLAERVDHEVSLIHDYVAADTSKAPITQAQANEAIWRLHHMLRELYSVRGVPASYLGAGPCTICGSAYHDARWCGLRVEAEFNDYMGTGERIADANGDELERGKPDA